MKRFKSKKVLIISIVVVAILLIAGIVFAFVGTDMFKSNKDMFFKYASQLFSDDKGIIDNKIIEYNNKKANSSYEFIGKITAEVDSDTVKKETLASIKNMNINVAGNVDQLNNKAEAVARVNYSNESNFTAAYKNANDITGVKFSDLSSKYFALNSKDLSSFVSKLGVNITTIDTPKVNISSEEKQILKQKYSPIIKNCLEDCTFLKVKGINSEGYTIEVTNQKLLEIVTKVLEEMQKDEQSIEIVNKLLGTDFKNTQISLVASILKEYKASEGKTSITIYQKDGIINKIAIQFNDIVNITLTKTSSDNDVSYNLLVETQNYSIGVKADYSGLASIQNVKENYEVDIIAGDSYKYIFEKTVNFTNDIKISDFQSSEYNDLNKLKDNQVGKFFETIFSKMDSVNKGKIKAAGITDENIWAKIFPSLDKLTIKSKSLIYKNDSVSKLNNDILENKEENKDKTTKENDEISSLLDDLENTTENKTNTTNENNTSSTNNTTNTTVNNTTNTENNSNTTNNENKSSTNIVTNIEKIEKETFNAMFNQYEGQNVRGTTVKSLVMKVIASNMSDEERQVKLTGDVVLTGDQVPDTIDVNKTYNVKCSTDLEGYINLIEIKENN